MALPILFRSTPLRSALRFPAVPNRRVGPVAAARGMDRLMDELWQSLGARPAPAAFSPSIDLAESEAGLRVSAELPGLGADEVHVELNEGVLRIHGEKAHTPSDSDGEESEDGWTRAERSYGHFERRIRIPKRFDAEAASARMENGVLTIQIPTKPSAQPREIPVEVSA